MTIYRKTRETIIANEPDDICKCLQMYVKGFKRFDSRNIWLCDKLRSCVFHSIQEFKLYLKQIIPRNKKARLETLGYNADELKVVDSIEKNRVARSLKTKKDNGSAVSHWTVKFWTDRGLSQGEAIEKIKGIQSSNSRRVPDNVRRVSSLRCLDHYIAKGYSEDEAIELRKLHQRTSSKRCVEYWISRGLSHEEALQSVSDYQRINAREYQKQPEELRRSRNRLCAEYWKEKGLNETEIKKRLKDNGLTFSLDLCISKYGNELGMELWKTRQEKWQRTLSSKSVEEIAAINASKSSGINLNFTQFWKGFKDTGMLYLVKIDAARTKVGITTRDTIEGRYGGKISRYEYITYKFEDVYNAYVIEREMVKRHADKIWKDDYGMFGWTEVINGKPFDELKIEVESLIESSPGR